MATKRKVGEVVIDLTLDAGAAPSSPKRARLAGPVKNAPLAEFEEKKKKGPKRRPAPDKWIQYFSKSTDDVGKRLSNFFPCQIVYAGKTYASVEHAYQAQKYAHLLGSDPETSAALVNRFTVSGDIGKQPAKVAKSAGSEKGMAENDCVLDETKWTRTKQVEIMTQLVKLRLEEDAEFKAIITKAKETGTTIFHFERCSGNRNPFWGGCFPKADKKKIWIGRNKMGRILMKSILPVPVPV